MYGKIYSQVARGLLERIGAGDYFNGTVSAEAEWADVQFRSTLIVYRDAASGAIADVVPVWWEFTGDGEICAELGWSELKERLLCRRG